MDVRTLDPDFVIFPTYKWLLGPYGRAFLYVAKRHQEKASPGADELRPPLRARRAGHLLRRHALRRRRPALRHGRARPLHLAGDGLDRHGDDGGLGQRGGRRAARHADRAPGRRPARARRRRSPRRACARRTSCASAFPTACRAGSIERLAAENIYVAPRLGRMRISPHVYNDEDDVDRFVAVMRRLLPRELWGQTLGLRRQSRTVAFQESEPVSLVAAANARSPLRGEDVRP